MSNLCTNCGRTLQEDAKYCLDCGKPVIPEIREKKKKVKYILTTPQRKIFLQRVLPTILIGSIIWLISEVIFSTIFIVIEFSQIFLVFYISMIVIEALLFTSLYFVSRVNNTQLALLIFFLFSFIAGILSLPIIMVTELLPQVHMFVSLSVGALLITCFLGIILRENYFTKGFLWAHIVLFLIGITLIEIVFILIFNIQNFLLTIPVSLAYILIVSLTTMFYGSKVVQKNEEKPWLISFYKIEAVLLVSLIIAIVILIVVFILVWIGIAAGGSDLDFSGFGGGTSKSRKKRKTKLN